MVVVSIVRRNGYSPRAVVVALFVVFALILGGGGTPNPATEILLEMVFVVMALGWVWLSRSEAGQVSEPRDLLVLVLVAVPLVIPVVQLIPLPPSIWTTFPGREDEVAALSLVGAEGGWRPISLSPARTVASLLSIVPAAWCCYAASRLTLHERRLVLRAILAMALATSIFGAIQLSAGSPGINFYPKHHVGWITGFQANRNAAADILLFGFLALVTLAAPYLGGRWEKLPLNLDRRSFSLLVAGLALLLLAATVMTGSRTGIALILVAGAAAAAILYLGRKRTRSGSLLGVVVGLAAALTIGLMIVFAAMSEQSALVRVVERFSDSGQLRANLWKDTWFALQQYWPVGFGLGGFEAAILPAERLEFLDPSFPNRAHNDFLEIGLEAGLLGYVMVGIAMITCIAMAWRARRGDSEMRAQVVFAVTVLLLIALHSVVDYPLRSMAQACLAGVAGGLLAKRTSVARHAPSFGAGEFVKGQA